MQGKMRFEFLGLTSFQGKKDPTKTYFSANLLQGAEVVKIFLQEGQDVLFNGIKKMDEVECDVEINVGVKTYVSLHSVVQLENGKPVKLPDNKTA